MTINKRLELLPVLLTIVVQSVVAGPRTMPQMKMAAQSAIKSSHLQYQGTSKEIKALVVKEQTALIGYEDGPFAVVSTDDRFPEVLGISMTPYSGGQNVNFEFWLNAMSRALAYRAANNLPARIITPDPAIYPGTVGPLCTSTWDQLTPYNNLLPSGIYTGCVATAMAQVLYYHKAPEHGTGERTIYAKGTPVKATFEDDYYDWDNMLDSYNNGGYSAEQADAVALLMRDCGVAANMQYGGVWDGGSGAYSMDAADGLRTYLNMPEAQCKERVSFTDEEWMDMVFNELANVGPLYYGGSDMSLFSGHAFVLHGYREDGMVYVNWGWSGNDDGWYDISLLNPPGYKFSAQQDMIIGVHGEETAKAVLSEAVHMEHAGTLHDKLAEIVPADSLSLIGELKITGPINGADMLTLRFMAGCDDKMNIFKGSLRSLDLSEANIVSGGGSFINVEGRHISTSTNCLPELAFYGCRSLKKLVLPDNIIKIGKGAFALCSRLDSIVFPEEKANQEYLLKNETLYLKSDTTVIFEVMPTFKGTYVVAKGKTGIEGYAFAGCGKITKIHLPSTVTRIGDNAFQSCSSVSEFRVAHREVPQTGKNVFNAVNFSFAKLYVPAGTKDMFKSHSEWGQFATSQRDNIMEYGSAVSARNAGRDYGEENPRFGYTFSGDRPNGEPELSCSATIDSPAGNYVIHVEPGTITDEIVEYFDATLMVWKATLRVSVGDYERYVGEENPVFELVYDGFKLDETPDVLTKLPIATTTATIDSPEGEYPIIISGGEAQNYEFRYKAGSLKVKANPTGIVELGQDGKPHDVFTTNGVKIGNSTGLHLLPKGIYLVNGRKVVLK